LRSVSEVEYQQWLEKQGEALWQYFPVDEPFLPPDGYRPIDFYFAPEEEAVSDVAIGVQIKKRENVEASQSNEPGRSGTSKRRRTTSPRRAQVEQLVTKKLNEQQLELTEDLTITLTDMYLAISSTESSCQLEDIITTLRQRDGVILTQKPSDITETIRILDSLKEFQQVASFLRRVYLLKLWNFRTQIEVLLRDGESTRSGNGQPSMLDTGSVVSNVFDHILAEAHPKIDRRPQGAKEIRAWRKKYPGERKALRNRLQAGKKWNVLSDAFSCGALALIPSGGEFNTFNSRYVNCCLSYRRC
jgi:hypothetical protein